MKKDKNIFLLYYTFSDISIIISGVNNNIYFDVIFV